MNQLFPILGIGLIAAAFLQFGLWTFRGLRLRRMENRKFDVELTKLRAEIFAITSQNGISPVLQDGISPVLERPHPQESQRSKDDLAQGINPWVGFRQFTVASLVKETQSCTSVYLAPADRNPIDNYLPGQHLTLRLLIPGQQEPVVRCYTLSDIHNGFFYRITIKQDSPLSESSPPQKGLVSRFVNRDLRVGDMVEVKAPSGNFYLQPGKNPVVLLAGGIGITPMLSMLASIANSSDKRECLLVYGSKNSGDHSFKETLASLASRHANIHVINCYSHPLPGDHQGNDYHVNGRVSVEVLTQLLPNQRFDFYLCGPPSFLQSIYDGLKQWGVSDNRIRYEAFRSTFIRRNECEDLVRAERSSTGLPVCFHQSKQTEIWKGDHENLLEFIEETGIQTDSGCRAGSCGTCKTRILKGRVQYNDEDQFDCEQGFILPCVARPVEAIEIDV